MQKRLAALLLRQGSMVDIQSQAIFHLLLACEKENMAYILTILMYIAI